MGNPRTKKLIVLGILTQSKKGHVIVSSPPGIPGGDRGSKIFHTGGGGKKTPIYRGGGGQTGGDEKYRGGDKTIFLKNYFIHSFFIGKLKF